MADFAAFREYQTRSSIQAEKDRALELRRRVLQDLSHNVQLLREECRRREESLQAERLRLAQRKALQDEKVAAKDAQANAQHEHITALDAEEARLRAELTEREAAMQSMREELQRRHELAERLRTAREGMTGLKCQLEERDARVMRLEARVAKMEMAAEKRHAALAERLPEYKLPRAEALGLEDMAGESILLIDEFN